MKRFAFLISLSFFFFSCGNQPEGKKVSDVKPDSVSVDSFPIAADTLLAGKPISFWINDQRLNEKTRRVLASRTDFRFSKDMDAADFTDSLFSVNDPDLRSVYFFAFTRTLKYADGYYAEGAGLSGMRFVKEKLPEFTRIFSEEKLLTDEDIQVWSKIVFSEISISCEKSETICLNKLIAELDASGKNLSENQKQVLNRFENGLKEEEGNFYKRQ